MTSFTPPSILGIDIATAKLDTHFQRVNGLEKPVHRCYDNTPAAHEHLLHWLSTQQVGPMPVCLEATGTYGRAVALRLHQAGYRVSIVNPLRIKRYGESELPRVKTDKSDAALIARFCLTQQPDPWTPPAPEQQQLQDLVRSLHDLQRLHGLCGPCSSPASLRLLSSRSLSALQTRSCQHSPSLVLPGDERSASQSCSSYPLSALARTRQAQDGRVGGCHAQALASDLWRSAFGSAL